MTVTVKVTQLCLIACKSMDLEFSRLEHWSGQPFPSPVDLPNPGIESRSPTMQVDSLPAEPQGKPKNTGVGSISLLQGIFPTQELNWGLLHCRLIVYQLNYQGSPPPKQLSNNDGIASGRHVHRVYSGWGKGRCMPNGH